MCPVGHKRGHKEGHIYYIYEREREGENLLYKGGHNKICALWGTKEGTKKDTLYLI